MTEKISIVANISIPKGPSISLNVPSIEIDGYEKINVSIKNGEKDKVVELWPSDTAGEVVLLAVVSNVYGDALTYKVNDATDDKKIKLDQPILLIGTSSINMLDSKPKKFKFTYDKPTGSTNKPKDSTGKPTDSTGKPTDGTPDVEIQIIIGLKLLEESTAPPSPAPPSPAPPSK